jgi:hypothetical protein
VAQHRGSGAAVINVFTTITVIINVFAITTVAAVAAGGGSGGRNDGSGSVSGTAKVTGVGTC